MTEPTVPARRASSAAPRIGYRPRCRASSWCSISALSASGPRAEAARDPGCRRYRALVPLARLHRAPAGASASDRRSWCSISALSASGPRAEAARDPGCRRYRALVPLARLHRAPAGASASGQRTRCAGSVAGSLRLAPPGAASPPQRGLGGRVALPGNYPFLPQPAAQPSHRIAAARGLRGSRAGGRRAIQRGGARRAAQPSLANARGRRGGRRLPLPGRDDPRRSCRAARLFAPASRLPPGARPAVAGTDGAERMTTRPARLIWPACLSALHLDRFLMGELTGAAAEQVRAHLAECARCSEAVDGMRMPRAEHLPPLRVVKRDPRARRWQRAAAAGLGIAAAASAVLLLRPATERVKGPGFALSMYVEHAGEVRRAGPTEAVSAGDAVRFVVTAPVNGS